MTKYGWIALLGGLLIGSLGFVAYDYHYATLGPSSPWVVVDKTACPGYWTTTVVIVDGVSRIGSAWTPASHRVIFQTPAGKRRNLTVSPEFFARLEFGMEIRVARWEGRFLSHGYVFDTYAL